MEKLNYFKIRKGDVVVILGAHQGKDTLFYAEKVGKEWTIVSIEPMERNYTILQETVKKSNYGNVALFNLAISDRTVEGEIYVGTNSINYSTTRNHGLGTHPIKTVTWDDLIELAKLDYVTLAKVDVEAAELQWLNGMTKQLPSYIIMEEHSRYGYDLKILFNILKEKGYTYTKEGYHIYAERKN